MKIKHEKRKMTMKMEQTIEDNEDNNRISYIKLINVGQKVITRNCTGYLPSQVAFYLQNVHIQPRSIYLSLNAENFDLVEDSGRLGGAESGRLTDSGRCYSRDIARYLLVQHKTEHVGCDSKDPNRGLLVLAGGARVHSETLLHLQVLFSCYNTALLNELRGGDLHMLSKEEIKVISLNASFLSRSHFLYFTFHVLLTLLSVFYFFFLIFY